MILASTFHLTKDLYIICDHYTNNNCNIFKVLVFSCEVKNFDSLGNKIRRRKMNANPMYNIARFSYRNICKGQKINTFSSKMDEPKVPTNTLKTVHTASKQKECGVPYSKKPFKIRLEAGKMYAWCLCGYSHSQPFCDKTHNNIFLKINLRPVWFTVEETKEYWLCNCKQTQNRPFCDGTHKRSDIQERKF